MPAVRKRVHTPNERMAVLEERLAAHVAADREMFATILKEIASAKSDLQMLVSAQSKQRGFLAGASFVWTALWSALVLAAGTAISYFRN